MTVFFIRSLLIGPTIYFSIRLLIGSHQKVCFTVWFALEQAIYLIIDLLDFTRHTRPIDWSRARNARLLTDSPDPRRYLDRIWKRATGFGSMGQRGEARYVGHKMGDG